MTDQLVARGGEPRSGSRAAAWSIELAALLLPPLFVAWFVGSERTVYFWDSANYWLKVVDLTARVRSDPAAAIAEALRSITTDKYNELAALPLLPAALLFGTDRATYATAVVVVLGLPTMLVLAWLVRRLVRFPADDRLPAVVALCVAALLPQLWLPVVLGILDVVGCIPILLVFVLCAPDPLALTWKRGLGVGALLGILPLLRRWYAFFSVTFVVVLAAIAVGAALHARWSARPRQGEAAPQPHGAPRSARRRVLVGLAMLTGALVAALPLVGPVGTGVFLRDHVFLHAPYLWTPGAMGALWRAWTYFGSVTLVLAAAGFALALRDPASRRLALLIGLQAVALLISFNAVQTFGANHFYLIVPALLVFASVAVLRFVAAGASARSRHRRLAAAIAVLAINFAMVLVPPLSASGFRMAAPLAAVFGQVRCAPERRGDLDELARLERAIAALRAERGAGSVYVLASSTVLNPDILRNAHLALPQRDDVPDLRDAIAPGAHVDRRDGFPTDLLAADIVLTAEPSQLHLAPEEQQVVLVPAAEIRARTSIGRAFRTVDDRFVLDGGVVAQLHVKDRPLAPDEVRELGERLSATHGGTLANLRAPDGVVGAH